MLSPVDELCMLHWATLDIVVFHFCLLARLGLYSDDRMGKSNTQHNVNAQNNINTHQPKDAKLRETAQSCLCKVAEAQMRQRGFAAKCRVSTGAFRP